MTDIDDRLRDYAHRWRAAQPAPPSAAALDPARRRRRRVDHPRRLMVIATAGAVVVAAAAAVAGLRHQPSTRVSTVGGTPSRPSTPLPTFDPARLAAARASLVEITSTLGYAGDKVVGSGIVIRSTGTVLTTNDVIDGATSIEVRDIGDGKTYTATVVGYDIGADMAVLQMQGASGLKTATIGDSTTVTVGQPVMSLGRAGEARGTVLALDQGTTATSPSGRSQPLTGLLKTDAPQPPGSVGGSFVDNSGQVIGLSTAAPSSETLRLPVGRIAPGSPEASPPTTSPPPTATGPTFAIPIKQALTIADQIETGRSSTGVHIGATAFLGVLIGSAPDNQATLLTLHNVIEGSPVARAGLAAGDVITALGGRPVGSAGALTAQLGRYHPGDKVAVTWTDPKGQHHSATVVLATGPAAWTDRSPDRPPPDRLPAGRPPPDRSVGRGRTPESPDSPVPPAAIDDDPAERQRGPGQVEAVPGQEVEQRSTPRSRRRPSGQEAEPVVGMGQVDHPGADQRRRLVPEDPPERRGLIADRRVGLGHRDEVGRVVDQGPEPGFAAGAPGPPAGRPNGGPSRTAGTSGRP